MAYYQQVLPMLWEVGEAVTRYNIAMIYQASGDLALAVGELEPVVERDRRVGHSDLADDTAMLERVRRELHKEPP